VLVLLEGAKTRYPEEKKCQEMFEGITVATSYFSRHFLR